EEIYHDNIRRIFDSLNLVSFDRFGKPFDLAEGIPDELLRVSLTEEFRQILAGNNVDFKESLRKEQTAWVEDLKKKSLEVFGKIPAVKKKAPARRKTDKDDSKDKARQDSKLQPKGAPVTVAKPMPRDNGGRKE
ncbi:MAG: hypothetical protein J5657_06070, partial [Clostridiales bacterium]|nr:hypothetical protein [Clostridiales bacterium]